MNTRRPHGALGRSWTGGLPAVSRCTAGFAIRSWLVGFAGGGLVLGLAANLLDRPDWAPWMWGTAILPVLAGLLLEISTKIRRGGIGLDVIAALAMAGALVLGETLAGVVVALMYSGGRFLEGFAEGRARREMTALLARAPKTAMRYSQAGLQEVEIEAIVRDDRILVRHGEVVPVDGMLATGPAVLDQAALTGESLPVRCALGDVVLSGSTNAGAPFELVATRRSAESTYAGIVRLVEAAQEIRPPMARLADRYALWFLGLTIVVTAASWLATGDPLRALAVLVVATPCPLILAVPVAIMSGVSRAARRGVLVKGGGVLEGLAQIHTVVIDKTGTLTEGCASLVAIHALGREPPDEVLRLVATLDLASHHVVAAALVAAARRQGLVLGKPTDVKEAAGAGLEGMVDGRHVIVGGVHYVQERIGSDRESAAVVKKLAGAVVVAVALDGIMAGFLVLADEIRADAPETLKRFRSCGVSRIVLASGDRADVTGSVGSRLDIDEVQSELTPQGKVSIIRKERARGPVMMVGDGVNDAPALAAANIGVALGARGAAASSEVADVVLLVDRIDRLADAIQIAQRSRRIAIESAVAGLALSAIAMGFAAFGFLPPVQGALLQEAIDVGVVVNALRALGGGWRS